ncbi:predicted protein [Aspergillus nidulans FGSC A4]|uniref:Uncharacterized protein n=1 Tax=Emericella nidulans (strain FGSC A4 / ATCC 38163 / CBS 112.46 / NRRL 194 / M139) TaxID=227321 RepID=Q5ARW7_EMENI|nr:hypothetical protein [Aspergillus nidulans FGSC A4]EAA63758.1 predicted protein [Aspergillus nidulans FGSC A4]CBF84559.1 TPA: conserved hypothetical protein [Aspergillus nidulans FGSC A4]|eukprot:XP_682232.1 predicted protein [Aspergillus nidulans FGSC A4]
MAPAAAKAERLPRPATDYERWLGDDEQHLDSVRQYDLDQGQKDYTNDGVITVAEDSSPPEIVDSDDLGSSPLSSDESSQPRHHYTRPTVPDIVALYAAIIIAVLLVLKLHGSLRRPQWRRSEEKKRQGSPLGRDTND